MNLEDARMERKAMRNDGRWSPVGANATDVAGSNPAASILKLLPGSKVKR